MMKYNGDTVERILIIQLVSRESLSPAETTTAELGHARFVLGIFTFSAGVWLGFERSRSGSVDKEFGFLVVSMMTG
jgi:hypothetical protein